MAAAVVAFSGDLLVQGWLRRGTRQPKTGWDKQHSQNGLKSRIKALVGFWEELRNINALRHQYRALEDGAVPVNQVIEQQPGDGQILELFKPYGTATPIEGPPPSYDETIQDLPPDYTCTNALITLCLSHDVKDLLQPHFYAREKNEGPTRSSESKIDLTKIEGVRSHANKKAKQAAKQAKQAKWGDDGEEENKDGAADGGEGGGDGGGDGGAGAGGDGGDPPGGGDGGGDDDDWGGFGGKKKDKKKKKKNAWEEFEAEDEEKKKAEEEEAAANAGATADPPADDWDAFAPVGGKKKKGKKGQAEPDPPPPPPPPVPESDTFDLGASAPAEANPDDDWGAFSTGKKKKGKKGKVCDFRLSLRFRWIHVLYWSEIGVMDELLVGFESIKITDTIQPEPWKIEIQG